MNMRPVWTAVEAWALERGVFSALRGDAKVVALRAWRGRQASGILFVRVRGALGNLRPDDVDWTDFPDPPPFGSRGTTG